MNQAILFNDDLVFEKKLGVWTMTGQISGERVKVFFHSDELRQLSEINSCTKYDLEEVTELWLEKNEPEQSEIHIQMK